jgi:sodium-dependent dicarboxylate transporter 2/3/5
MLLPIVLAVQARLGQAVEPAVHRRVQIALLLSVAYGANLGGMGTYIGTPPNLIFRERYASDFFAGQPGGPPEISFLLWMAAFAPMVLLFLPVVWLILSARLPAAGGAAAEATLRAEREALPGWSRGEVAVAAVFASAALLWITRVPIRVGEALYLGWSRWLPDGYEVSDGTVAIAMALLCFLISVRRQGREGEGADGGYEPLLDWQTVQSKLPWGIVLLYGAGFALGDTFHTSGLSQTLGEQLSRGLRDWPPLLVIGSIAALMALLTEVTSNTASTNVILPILSAVALDLDLPAPMMLLPATLAASCAFMLPVATPPNAIVFASGLLPIRAMVVRGIAINVASVVWITCYLRWIALPMFGVTVP